MATTSKIPFGNYIKNRRGDIGFHNSIFIDEKICDLNGELPSDISNRITSGNFDDIFVGMYFNHGDIKYRIADIAPYYHCGDTISLGYHVAVVLDISLYSVSWNATDDTSEGYVSSAIRANIKGDNTDTSGAEAKMIAAFGENHVLSYRAWYPDTYDNGVATNANWTDARVELMNEMEVYGALVWSMGGLGHEVGISKRQFSLFRLSPQFVNIRESWWLRGVMSDRKACQASTYGNAYYNGTSLSRGVRPFALIA